LRAAAKATNADALAGAVFVDSSDYVLGWSDQGVGVCICMRGRCSGLTKLFCSIQTKPPRIILRPA
jgi:hypothetical protein